MRSRCPRSRPSHGKSNKKRITNRQFLASHRAAGCRTSSRQRCPPSPPAARTNLILLRRLCNKRWQARGKGPCEDTYLLLEVTRLRNHSGRQATWFVFLNRVGNAGGSWVPRAQSGVFSCVESLT